MDIEEITKYDKKLDYHKIIIQIFMVIMSILFIYNLISHGPIWKIMVPLLSILILILAIIIIYILKMVINIAEDMGEDNLSNGS